MVERALTILGKAATEWGKDNNFQRSAAIAFFATFSVAPMLIIGISISGFFFGTESVREAAFEKVEGFVGPEAIQFLSGVMEKTFEPSDNVIAIIVGLVALLFGAAGAFFQIEEALERMWEKYHEKETGVKKILRDVALPVLLVFGIGVVFIAMSLFRTTLAFISRFLNDFVDFNITFIFILDLVVSIGVTVLVFMFIYRIFSPVKYKWKFAFYGALVSTALLQLGRFIVDLYIGFAGVSVIYGAAGSLAVLMVWIFFSSVFFLYGAEVAKVTALEDNKKRKKKKFIIF